MRQKNFCDFFMIFPVSWDYCLKISIQIRISNQTGLLFTFLKCPVLEIQMLKYVLCDSENIFILFSTLFFKADFCLI